MILFKYNNTQKESKNRWLISIILGATLLQNYYDLVNILEGGQLALYVYEGPIFAKIGKDICYFAIILSIFLNIKKVKFTSSLIMIGLILCLTTFMMMISIYFNGVVLALVGLRWILPFLILLLIGDWVQKVDRKFFSTLIFSSIIGCLILQIIQLFIMPPVFGEIIFGLSARTPGFFMAPNSAAFYGCSCAALILVAHGHEGKISIISLLIAFFISALAQSGTGLIVASLLIFWYIIYPNFKLFIFAALVLSPLIFFNLNYLTGRENYVEISGGWRLEIFKTILYDSMGSIASFGKYTNAANLISENPENQDAPDSLIASWVGNFGMLWPLVTIFVIAFVIVNKKKFQKIVFGPLLVFLLFSMTTIIFEAFPMNIILAIAIWWSRLTPSLNKVL